LWIFPRPISTASLIRFISKSFLQMFLEVLNG
jgi:hypothetical protein